MTTACRSQTVRVCALLFAGLRLCAPLCAQQAAPAIPQSVRAVLRASAAPEMTPVGKYVGPGSCSAVACHGGIQPLAATKVLQNEYSTWVTEDKHARAYTALVGPLGRQMAAVLRIGSAEKAPKCLACHALSVDAAHRAREFDVAEGVSCESCHGPASAWLGPHIQPTARHEDMVRLGMVDGKDLAVRTERCLSCHLGAGGMEVDHEMIAAGHPDLTFELDSFTAVEPPHWVEKHGGEKDVDPLFGVRAWSVGAAVELRESMLRVARRAKSGPWPEFSEMDCITCHHALTGGESWRQKDMLRLADGEIGTRRVGDPPYNLARYVVFEHFANEVDAGTAREMEQAVAEVSHLIATMSADRAATANAAERGAGLAGKLVGEVQSATYDRARTERLLRAIAGDGDRISRQGERTAEQAAMTVNSLYIALTKAGGGNAGTRAAIDRLFAQMKNPSGYNGPQFAAGMKGVAATLR